MTGTITIPITIMTITISTAVVITIRIIVSATIVTWHNQSLLAIQVAGEWQLAVQLLPQNWLLASRLLGFGFRGLWV